MTGKPKLIVHAGLPKCATTSLQWLLYQDAHRICRALGLVWIGKGLKPWGTGAPVSEIMYGEADAIRALAQQHLDPGSTYFLSSEALAQHHGFLSVLAQHFELQKIVLTIRLPLLKEVSQYCFSGWLRRGLIDWPLTDRSTHIAKLMRNLGAFAPLHVCPIEPAGLAERFCSLLSDTIVDGADELLGGLGSANASISPVLADALHCQLTSFAGSAVTGPRRQQIVTSIRESPEAHWFKSEQPKALHDLLNRGDLISRELADYQRLLQDFGVAEDLARDAADCAKSQVLKLADHEVPDAKRQDQIEFYAKRLLARAFDQP